MTPLTVIRNTHQKHIVEYEKGGILIPVSPVSSYHGRLLSSSHSPARTFLDSDQSHLFWGGHSVLKDTVLGEKTPLILDFKRFSLPRHHQSYLAAM